MASMPAPNRMLRHHDSCRSPSAQRNPELTAESPTASRTWSSNTPESSADAEDKHEDSHIASDLNYVAANIVSSRARLRPEYDLELKCSRLTTFLLTVFLLTTLSSCLILPILVTILATSSAFAPLGTPHPLCGMDSAQAITITATATIVTTTTAVVTTTVTTTTDAIQATVTESVIVLASILSDSGPPFLPQPIIPPYFLPPPSFGSLLFPPQPFEWQERRLWNSRDTSQLDNTLDPENHLDRSVNGFDFRVQSYTEFIWSEGCSNNVTGGSTVHGNGDKNDPSKSIIAQNNQATVLECPVPTIET
ncbi:hypothetical protein GQ53DRAFT_818399 [Thozetella sp. PMI_491]|nr:hypothetical protein GQ53DRAFT_818399 [Thozetella sp. PMI_491]